jgi:hypothetical protein
MLCSLWKTEGNVGLFLGSALLTTTNTTLAATGGLVSRGELYYHGDDPLTCSSLLPPNGVGLPGNRKACSQRVDRRAALQPLNDSLP